MRNLKISAAIAVDYILIPSDPNQGQNEKKQINNIKIQIQSGKNVFLRRKGISVFSTHHQLSVEHQVLGQITTYQ